MSSSIAAALRLSLLTAAAAVFAVGCAAGGDDEVGEEDGEEELAGSVEEATDSSESALAGFRFFRSPSGRINCVFNTAGNGIETGIRCDYPSNDRCAYLMGRRAGQRTTCTDSVASPDSRVIKYGTHKKYGAYKCGADPVKGMTCVRGSHGFSVSAERQRTW